MAEEPEPLQDNLGVEQENASDHSLVSDGTSQAYKVDQQQEGGQNNEEGVTSSTTRLQHAQQYYDQLVPAQQQPIMQHNQIMTQQSPNMNSMMIHQAPPPPGGGGSGAPQQHHPALAMAQYYEAQMRDHAAAYASAAAGAAWAAAQIACSVTSNLPPALPQTTPFMYGPQHPSQLPPHPFSPNAGPQPYPPLLSPPLDSMIPLLHLPSADASPQEQQIQTQPNNENDTSNTEEGQSYNRPEKRQQRMMPEDKPQHQQDPMTTANTNTAIPDKTIATTENVTTTQQEATSRDNPPPRPQSTRPTPMNPLSPAFQPPVLDSEGGAVFYHPNPSMSPLSEGSAMNHNHLHQHAHPHSQPLPTPFPSSAAAVPPQHPQLQQQQPSPFGPQHTQSFPPSAPPSDPNIIHGATPPFYHHPPVADGLSPQFYSGATGPLASPPTRMVDGVPRVPQQHHHQQQYRYSFEGIRRHNGKPHYQQQQQQQQHSGTNDNNNATNMNSKRGRRRLRSSIDNYSSGGESSSMGGGGGGSGNNTNATNKASSTKSSNYKKHKQKSPRTGCSDDSLVGKTGISALHEWCAKRRMQPPNFFLEGYKEGQCPEFEISCRIQSQEWGRGRAGTKVAARQDAARRALQALVPGGVVFDNNGILTSMPFLGTGIDKLSATATSTAAAAATSVASAVNTESSLVDDVLTPNLAFRLAIDAPDIGGADDEGGNSSNNNVATKRNRNRGTASMATAHPKRRFNIYPGTSTTSASEDDDENAFYASRGASVCSSLLHAMCQIDARLPEPPTYEFAVVANSAESIKTPSEDEKIVSDSMKRSFSCRASLYIRPQKKTSGENTDSSSKSEEETGTEQTEAPVDTKEIPLRLDSEGEGKASTEDAKGDTKNHEKDGSTDKSEKFEVIGTGASKREARHVASAKLLALLFPEFSGMAEVKAAAEAVREKYAASKALKQQQKQQSKRAAKFTDVRIRQRRRNFTALPQKYNVSFALPTPNDPPLPSFLSERLQAAICCNSPTVNGQPPHKRGVEGLNKIAALSISENPDSTTGKEETIDGGLSSSLHNTEDSKQLDESVARQLSRRRQLEEEVDTALLVQSEIDDGGRYLKAEVSEDDVGRIVLRRAGPEDLLWIQKLLPGHQQERGKDFGSYHFGKYDSVLTNEISPVALLQDASSPQNDGSEINQQLPCLLWGSSAVVMLFCRAVALRDEPPLGVAVLTLGFSMKRGRILKISEMAHEQHVPEERFVESLEVFAKNMKCALERKTSNSTSKNTRDTKTRENITESKEIMHLGSDDLKAILNAHMYGKNNNTNTDGPSRKVDTTPSPTAEEAFLDDEHNSSVFFFGKADSGAPLQSVKEEECEGDEEKHKDSDSGNDRRGSKGQDKASKRARGQNKPSKRSRVS